MYEYNWIALESKIYRLFNLYTKTTNTYRIHKPWNTHERDGLA